jgi:hypothetical protein
MLVATFLWAITHTMANGLAVGALDLGALSLSSLLLAILCRMAHFYSLVSNELAQTWSGRIRQTITVAAL